MSRHEKLIKRFRRKPLDFRYAELKTLLASFGYREQLGASGSRVAFVHATTLHVIRPHKPHPGTILKRYQIDLVMEVLSRQGYLQ